MSDLPPVEFVESLAKLSYKITEVEATVQRHFETMGEQVGALDTRVRRLENENAANEIKDILGELYSWADKYEILFKHKIDGDTVTMVRVIHSFKDKIAGIQKRYGIG